jgi:hypothetical protein
LMNLNTQTKYSNALRNHLSNSRGGLGTDKVAIMA